MSEFDDWLIDYTDGDDWCDRDVTQDMEFAFNAARVGMIKKADVLAMVNSCLVRDPTLQILAKQIEEME